MEREKYQPAVFVKIGSYLFLTFFCLFLVLAAVAARTHRVESLKQTYQQQLVPTDASVSSHQYIRSSDGFSIQTHYRFIPPGSSKTFFGQDRFDRTLYKTEAEATAATENFSSTVKIFYHPQNPADSSQQPPPPHYEKPRTLLWTAGILGLCAGATGLGRVIWDRYWRSRKLESFSFPSLLLSLMFNGLALVFAYITVIIALTAVLSEESLFWSLPTGLICLVLLRMGASALFSSFKVARRTSSAPF